MNEHLHESRKNSARVSSFVVVFDILNIFDEMFEDMGGRKQGNQEAK